MLAPHTSASGGSEAGRSKMEQQTRDCFLRRNQSRSFGICIATVPVRLPNSDPSRRAVQTQRQRFVHTVDSVNHGGPMRPVCGSGAPRAGDVIRKVNNTDVIHLNHDDIITLVCAAGDILHLNLAPPLDQHENHAQGEAHAGARRVSIASDQGQQPSHVFYVEPAVLDDANAPAHAHTLRGHHQHRSGNHQPPRQYHQHQHKHQHQQREHGQRHHTDGDTAACRYSWSRDHLAAPQARRYSQQRQYPAGHHGSQRGHGHGHHGTGADTHRRPHFHIRHHHGLQQQQQQQQHPPASQAPAVPRFHYRAFRAAAETGAAPSTSSAGPRGHAPCVAAEARAGTGARSPALSCISSSSEVLQHASAEPSRRLTLTFSSRGQHGAIVLRGGALSTVHTGVLTSALRASRLLHAHAAYSEPAAVSAASDGGVGGSGDGDAMPSRQACLELVTVAGRDHALFLVAVCQTLTWLHQHRFRLLPARHAHVLGAAAGETLHLVRVPSTAITVHDSGCDITEHLHAPEEEGNAVSSQGHGEPSPSQHANSSSGSSHGCHGHSDRTKGSRRAWFALHIAPAHVTVVEAPGAALGAITDTIQEAVDAVADQEDTDDVQVLHRTHEPAIDVYDLTRLGRVGRTAHPAPKLLPSVQAALGHRGWWCRAAPVLSGVEDRTCYLFTRVAHRT